MSWSLGALAEPVDSENRRYRLDWAALLSRIFGIDVMTCAEGEGKLCVVAKVDNSNAVAAMLRHLGRYLERKRGVVSQA